MSSQVRSFKDLIVWQKAMGLVVLAYKLSSKFPEEEKFGLTSLFRRSTISVPSNIAEGWGRKSSKSFIAFLHIAQGSLCECETQLILAHELGFVKKEDTLAAESIISEIGRMLIGLEKSLTTT